MATDYDAPRRSSVDELEADSLEELQARSRNDEAASIDDDDDDSGEPIDVPANDLSGEELITAVEPKKKTEFTCMGCFLVQHRSRIGAERDGMFYCEDCA